MIPEELFFGGNSVITVADHVQLSPGLGRVKYMNVSQPNLVATLPVLNPPMHISLRSGGPVFILVNTGAYSLTVEDTLQQTVGVININQACLVLLTRADDPVGEWAMACLPFFLNGAGTSNTTGTTATTVTTGTTKATTATTPDPCSTTGNTATGTTLTKFTALPSLECTTRPATWNTAYTLTAQTLKTQTSFGEFHRILPHSIIGMPSTEEGI